MPEFVEKEAKTIDEAIQLALEELNIELEDAKVDILDEGSKAKLGIFGGEFVAWMTASAYLVIHYRKKIKSYWWSV